MHLIDELQAEHALIERAVGSFLTFATQLPRGETDPADGVRFLRFFRLYAGDFHHAREEDILFVALVEQVHLPAGRGPIGVLKDEHRRMAAMLDSIEALLVSGASGAAEHDRLRTLATAYGHALWHHIDAENSVLLPESEARLRKKSVGELPSREMTGAERDAKQTGEDLVRRYPPLYDRDIMRGDGCVLCPAYTDSCRGLEAEWWNESEWEEFEDHLPSS